MLKHFAGRNGIYTMLWRILANILRHGLIILLFGTAGPMYSQETPDRPTSYEDDLELFLGLRGDSVRYTIKNKLVAPIEIIVYTRKDDKEVEAHNIPAKDSLVLFQFNTTNIDSIRTLIKNEYRVAYFVGNAQDEDIDTDYLYRLPFKKGKKYEVSQGWGGKASHHGEKSYYAIDFQLNVGEPIHAARDGIVVLAIDWFTKKGGPELRNSANRIVVLHDDGTIASYAHLQYKGVLVKVGEKIAKGQKIGYSGLTGHTRGPHLHFVVRKARDIAIPIYFEGYPNQELKRRKRYKVK